MINPSFIDRLIAIAIDRGHRFVYASFAGSGVVRQRWNPRGWLS